ncbi:MAG TPA: ATP-binding protein [Candidatus Dormibacteraeota bacterium]|nr:ATP-binding protein [Candidatus Dormibacteraeota bacterium]
MIEQGQLPRDEVIKLIESQEALWTRIAASRIGDEWHESLMEVTSAPMPPRWTPKRWDYEQAVFVSSETTGAEVADWLRKDAALLHDIEVKLPTVQQGQTVQWWQWAGAATNAAYETLAWPCKSYQLVPQSLAAGVGSGALIGQGPSFVRFADAAARFFEMALGVGASVDHLPPTFRLQDVAGRIAKILLGATEIQVTVEGDSLGGMALELASDAVGPIETLSGERNQTVRFPLPNGVPAGAWVVLKQDFCWIDRKFINYPYTAADPGVEVVVEPMTELQALVSGGEGDAVEFKSDVPVQGSDTRRNVCRTVAAFANGSSGGQVLFGVRDDGTIIGLPGGSNVKEACDTVTRFVTSMVTPLPDFSIQAVQIEADPPAAVIVLTVESGSEPPYGVQPANPQYYVRRGATTFPASADQVRALARSRPPADQGHGSPYGPLHLLR